MPALAVAEELRQHHPGVRLVLVGAERGIESRILPKRGFRFHLLPGEPIYRQQWWKNVRWPFILLRLLRRVDLVLKEECPAAVLGTGGYAAGPLVWMAAQRRIPTAIQEQNAYPGIASRRLARQVNHVYLGLQEAAAHLHTGAQTRTFTTGNPILPPDPARREAALKRFAIPAGRPVLLVTGGSQGALAVNRVVARWLAAGGGRDCVVLWATGRTSYPEFRSLNNPPAVQVIEFLDPIADAYAVADLVVSRAGALTIAELCAWGLPSILIPLPSAAADHQAHNARAMATAGASRVLLQADLSPETLAREVSQLLGEDTRRQQMAIFARERGHPDAAARIVSHLLTLLPPSPSFAK